MAFVNRAERKLILYNKTTDIGPGAYIGPMSYKVNTNYAPFSTSSERAFEKPLPTYTPGPGSYVEPTKRLPQKYSSAFASQKSRFERKFENLPGPGSYNVTPRWSEKKITSKSVSSTNWVRLPSAPSIPNNNQAYGYEETTTGELVLHKGPRMTSGTNKDSVGPGHYNPKFITSIKAVE